MIAVCSLVLEDLGVQYVLGVDPELSLRRQLLIVAPGQREVRARLSEAVAGKQVPLQEVLQELVPVGTVHPRELTPEPVDRELGIHEIVDRPVIAEVRDLSPDVARGEKVVDPETRWNQAAATPRADVLRDERKPGDRNVAHVEDHRPGHEGVLVDELDLSRGEAVVRELELARGKLTRQDKQGIRARRDGVSPNPPRHSSIRELGLGIEDRTLQGGDIVIERARVADDLGLLGPQEGDITERGDEA